jgi:hypothetical protein
MTEIRSKRVIHGLVPEFITSGLTSDRVDYSFIDENQRVAVLGDNGLVAHDHTTDWPS